MTTETTPNQWQQASDRARVRETLDEARGLYEDFRQAFSELGRLMKRDERDHVRLVADRVEAYMPEFDPGFDWGMGDKAEDWFDAIERALDGTDEEDDEPTTSHSESAEATHGFRPCEACGGSPDVHNANRGRDFIGHEYR